MNEPMMMQICSHDGDEHVGRRYIDMHRIDELSIFST
jgi:hypothetical protein